MTRRKNALDAQSKVDADTITNLQRQLEQQKHALSNNSKEQVALQQRRTMDLREVNATLLSLSKDKGFQQVETEL